MAKIYQIPVNFNQSGYVFNGLIETRKAIEAAGGAVLGYFFCSLFPVSGVAAISFYVFFMIIFALIGFAGIQGEPVTSYLFHVWRWFKIRKKPYLYNPNGETYAISASQVHMEETSVQDALADAWDNFRSKFGEDAPEYIEGKTFVFASDPLMERLKEAQERLNEDDGEETVDENEEPIEDAPQDSTADFNVDDIFDSFTINEKGDIENG